jgi:hypothetical protein
VEQLDHRQLLSVNFTGNVPVDFPASQSPGVVVLPNNPSVIHPSIPPLLQPIVRVSGFDINGIRVSYDSTTDTLSFGIDQPASGNPGQGEVIAGDADNNGNSGTVNPAIPAIQNPPGIFPFADFQDFPDFMGSEYMGAFLDFTGSGTPQIVAGYSEVNPVPPTPSNPNPPKPYEVAVANPAALPDFGTPLPQFTGTVYSQNSPTAPNMEFTITHFSQLYQMETGKPLTSSSVIYIGGQAGSANDIGIGEAFFPEQSVNIGAATQPVHVCPPQSPTIYVNPHEHRIVDSLHRDLVRVTILGTSGFNVNNIIPSSVTLDGVHAIAHVTRKVRRDEFPMATYVFVANQLNLHKGLNNVTLDGTLTDGTTFETSKAVLNVPYASQVRGPLARYMGHGGVYKSLSRIEARHPSTVSIPSTNAEAVTRSANPAPGRAAGLDVSYAPVVHTTGKQAERKAPRPVVSIKRAEAAATDVITKLPTLLRHSMNDFLGHLGLHTSSRPVRARHAG